ncbi:hypothetical protein PVAP13_5KG280014 [Panicum virgatum]|uniref:Uncharacterized protein n=1 Tax=Panicum virgatum TaxID=38727 RepID=A0A8T0SMU4_PANVG|nr:hypothetical protein PVAP13_5KG280014 [Panicum virgatum]
MAARRQDRHSVRQRQRLPPDHPPAGERLRPQVEALHRGAPRRRRGAPVHARRPVGARGVGLAHGGGPRVDAGAPGRHQGAAGAGRGRDLASAPRHAGGLPPDRRRRRLPGLACGGDRLLHRARHHGPAVRPRLLRGSSLLVPVCASAVPGADSGDTALADAFGWACTIPFVHPPHPILIPDPERKKL